MDNVEIRLRIDASLKEDAETLFKNMGMTMSEAIRVFLKQSVNSYGLPFRPHIKVPNQETIEAFKEVDSGDFTECSLDEFKKYIEEIDDKKY